MALSLWDRFFGRTPLDSVPYDELLRRYSGEPTEVFTEFMRRLYELVFMAAEDYCKRQGRTAIKEAAEERTMAAFHSFVPQMGSGQPEMGLRRFAAILRSALDEQAFGLIKRAYYRHLLLYYLKDEDQRRCLEAMYAMGLAATPRQIAARFLLPVKHVEQLLKDGNRELERILKDDFEEAELREITEGFLP